MQIITMLFLDFKDDQSVATTPGPASASIAAAYRARPAGRSSNRDSGGFLALARSCAQNVGERQCPLEEGAQGAFLVSGAGSAEAANGKIYGIPRDSNSVLIDPVTNKANTATTITGLSGDDKWAGGVLSPGCDREGRPRSDPILTKAMVKADDPVELVHAQDVTAKDATVTTSYRRRGVFEIFNAMPLYRS